MRLLSVSYSHLVAGLRLILDVWSSTAVKRILRQTASCYRLQFDKFCTFNEKFFAHHLHTLVRVLLSIGDFKCIVRLILPNYYGPFTFEGVSGSGAVSRSRRRIRPRSGRRASGGRGSPPRLLSKLFLSSPRFLRAEDHRRQRRQRERQRVRLSVGRGFLRPGASVAYAAPTVAGIVGVQDLLVAAPGGNPDAVVFADGRGEVARDDDEVLRVLRPAQEGRHAISAVAALDPLEPLWLEVHLVEGWRRLVEGVEIAHQGLDAGVVPVV